MKLRALGFPTLSQRLIRRRPGGCCGSGDARGSHVREEDARANEKRGERKADRKPVYGSEGVIRRAPDLLQLEFTRSSSGVMVAHVMPTLSLRIASVDSTVTLLDH